MNTTDLPSIPKPTAEASEVNAGSLLQATSSRSVFVLTVGDRRHGDAVRGVYATRDAAVESLPSHVEEMLKCHGGSVCVMRTSRNDPNWWEGNNGIFAYLREWPVQA